MIRATHCACALQNLGIADINPVGRRDHSLRMRSTSDRSASALPLRRLYSDRAITLSQALLASVGDAPARVANPPPLTWRGYGCFRRAQISPLVPRQPRP